MGISKPPNCEDLYERQSAGQPKWLELRGTRPLFVISVHPKSTLCETWTRTTTTLGLDVHLHLLYDLDNFPTNPLHFSFHIWQMGRAQYPPHRMAVGSKMKRAASRWVFYPHGVAPQGTAFFHDSNIRISGTGHVSTVKRGGHVDPFPWLFLTVSFHFVIRTSQRSWRAPIHHTFIPTTPNI